MKTDWISLMGKYFYVVVADYIPVIMLKGIKGKCVFLEQVGGVPTCTIYPARPMRCRLYPFIPISPTEKSALELSTRCPGVGHGEPRDPPWDDLAQYLEEVRSHYSLLYKFIFEEGLEPVKALEKALDNLCSSEQ